MTRSLNSRTLTILNSLFGWVLIHKLNMKEVKYFTTIMYNTRVLLIYFTTKFYQVTNYVLTTSLFVGRGKRTLRFRKTRFV